MRRALCALAGWELERGAREAYLQAHPTNETARAVYGPVGFTTDHEYRYWEAPA